MARKERHTGAGIETIEAAAREGLAEVSMPTHQLNVHGYIVGTLQREQPKRCRVRTIQHPLAPHLASLRSSFLCVCFGSIRDRQQLRGGSLDPTGRALLFLCPVTLDYVYYTPYYEIIH